MRFLPVAAFALLLAGCPTTTPDPPANTDRMHQDLPAPDGFTYTENLTRTNPTGTWRFISQKLVGKKRRVKQTAAWYRETFPVRKWKLQTEKTAATGATSLVFVKREEQCTVMIVALSPTDVSVHLKVDRRK